MRKQRAIFASLLALALVIAAAGPLFASEKAHQVKAEIVSVDAKAKTVTFKDDKGESHTAPVLAQALERLGTLKAGDKVMLTCSDNEKGEHQGISAIQAASDAGK